MPRRKQPDPLLLRLGRRIRALRIERKLSLEQMVWGADLSGKGHLSDAENGRSLPTLITLGKIARVLEVELIDILNFPELGLRHRLLELTRYLGPEAVDLLIQQAERLLRRFTKGR